METELFGRSILDAPRGPVIPLIGEQKPQRIHMTGIHPEALFAFFELYYGIEEAADNGTGYSPKVAEAMKKLKPYFEKAEIKAAEKKEPTALELGAAVRRLGLAGK